MINKFDISFFGSYKFIYYLSTLLIAIVLSFIIVTKGDEILVLSISMTAMILLLLIKYREKSKWMKTDATILTTQIKEVYYIFFKDYRPLVKYEYYIEGIKFLGYGLCFDDFLNIHEKKIATKIIKEIEAMSKFEIYYRKNRPSDSVIYRKTGKETNKLLLFTIFSSGVLFLIKYLV